MVKGESGGKKASLMGFGERWITRKREAGSKVGRLIRRVTKREGRKTGGGGEKY